jgi:hypothetical protein
MPYNYIDDILNIDSRKINIILISLKMSLSIFEKLAANLYLASLDYANETLYFPLIILS